VKVQAFLADAVSTRANLLHVLGGGVTRLWRAEYPAPMNVELALLITLHPTEAAEPHRLRVVIQDIDGEQIAQLDGQFGIDAAPPSPTGRQPGESLILPVGLNLRGVAIPREGSYSVEVLVDNQHVESLFFMVTPQRGPEAAEPSED
jgi:hypothetical protein